MKKLIRVFDELVSKGNTVVVIEHNLDIIKSADYVLDLGPDGGDGGGEIVATGTPEEVALDNRSYTGQFLKRMLSEAVSPETLSVSPAIARRTATGKRAGKVV